MHRIINNAKNANKTMLVLSPVEGVVPFYLKQGFKSNNKYRTMIINFTKPAATNVEIKSRLKKYLAKK